MSRMTRAKMIVAIVLGALGLIVVLQNFQAVETRLLLWRLTMPHVVVLAIVFGAGCILGAVLAVMWCIRQFKDTENN